MLWGLYGRAEPGDDVEGALCRQKVTRGDQGQRNWNGLRPADASHHRPDPLQGHAPKVARRTHAPRFALSERQTGVTKVKWLVRLSLSNRPPRRRPSISIWDGTIPSRPPSAT